MSHTGISQSQAAAYLPGDFTQMPGFLSLPATALAYLMPIHPGVLVTVKIGEGLRAGLGGFRERHPELSDQSAQHPPRSLHSPLQGKVSMLQKACFAFYEPLIRAAMWLAEFLEVNRRDVKEWSQLRWR